MHLGHFISFEKFLLGGWWWCTNDNRTSLSLFSSHKATLDLTLSVHLSVCNAFSKHLNPISDGGVGGMTGLFYKCEKKKSLLCCFVSIICDLISVRAYVQT